MSSPKSSRALASPITSMTMKGSMALRSARGRGSPLAFCAVTRLTRSYDWDWRYSELLASDTRHAVAVFKRQSKPSLAKTWARWVSSVFAPGREKPASLPVFAKLFGQADHARSGSIRLPACPAASPHRARDGACRRADHLDLGRGSGTDPRCRD